MVFTRPMRLASEAAKIAESAERMAPIEKRVPRADGVRENFVWKKYMTHELYIDQHGIDILGRNLRRYQPRCQRVNCK